MATTSDRIEKKIRLGAPRARVWRALADSKEFGHWFGVRFDGPFAEGSRMVGHVTPTKVDAEVAATQKAYEGAKFEITIERMEPERLFSFRWHPFAVDPNVDYSREPATLVAFSLEDDGDGTLLRLTESGFDQVPASRREKAFTMNEQGWAAQMKLIEKYLSHAR